MTNAPVVAAGGKPAPAESEFLKRYWRNPKLDQLVCFWMVPAFFQVFAIVMFYFTRLIPPPHPDWSPDQIIAWFHDGWFQDGMIDMRIGMFLFVAFLGLSAVTNALVLVHMRRMEGVGAVVPYIYVAALGVSVLPGATLLCLSYTAAAMRPDRDPAMIAFLYDFGMLTFVGSLGCFCVQYFAFMLAIFRDKRQIFPRWLGYYSFFALGTELVGGLMLIFKTGPFTWNGGIAFWEAMAIFGSWQGIMITCLMLAIKKQPLEEIEAHVRKRLAQIEGGRA
jgi:hypothetical protein